MPSGTQTVTYISDNKPEENDYVAICGGATCNLAGPNVLQHEGEEGKKGPGSQTLQSGRVLGLQHV